MKVTDYYGREILVGDKVVNRFDREGFGVMTVTGFDANGWPVTTEHGAFEPDEMAHDLPKITRAEYAAIPADYRGTFRGIGNGAAHPEWIGRKTMLQQPPVGPACSVLLIEGVGFEFVD